MKKKIIITLIIVFLILILVPVPNYLKDGGSVEYISFIYKITKYHKLVSTDKNVTYNDGLKIELFGITLFNNYEEVEVTNKPLELTENFEIKIIEEIGCKSEPKLYYETDNKKIYNICLNSIEIKDENIVYPLTEILKNNNIDNILEKITSKLEFVLSYDDGGSSIYKNNNLTLLKCNTLKGNQNIYISSDLFDLDNKYCLEEKLN